MSPTPAATWAVHDGLDGHRRQVMALAAALDPAPRELSLRLQAPWDWFAPRRLPGAVHGFDASFAAALAAAPPLALGCGRRAALATRLLRECGTRTVQVLDPRIDGRHWDLLVLPVHDGRDGANVITLRGSLNPVDEAWLAAGRRARPDLAALPRPVTTVLLGGRTRAVRFDRAAFEVMASRLERWLALEGGSLLVLGSRRTHPLLAGLARSYWAEVPGQRWFSRADGANPYAAALAVADRIVASPDSINMVSEACATRAPVFVAEPGRATGRVRRFLDDLLASGRIRALASRPETFEVEPLRETPRVAALVRERLGA